MEYSQDPKRRLVRGISDQILAEALESDGFRRQIGSAMSLMRELGQRLHYFKNSTDKAMCFFETVLSDEVVYLLQVFESFRVKTVTDHCR